eukprot:1374106-Amphidinium_carterae.2
MLLLVPTSGSTSRKAPSSGCHAIFFANAVGGLGIAPLGLVLKDTLVRTSSRLQRMYSLRSLHCGAPEMDKPRRSLLDVLGPEPCHVLTHPVASVRDEAGVLPCCRTDLKEWGRASPAVVDGAAPSPK